MLTTTLLEESRMSMDRLAHQHAAHLFSETVRIVVIEGNEDHLRLIEQALKRSFPKSFITTFTCGRDALAFFRQKRTWPEAEQIELILLDIDLPDYDSIQLIEHLKRSKMYRSIPIVILSDHEWQPAVQKALEVGAEECIVKPFDFHDFTDLLHQKLRPWLTS